MTHGTGRPDPVRDRTRPARSRWGRTLARLVLIVLLLSGLVVAIQWLWAVIEAPWSIEGSGPTLTGTWVGPLHAQLGGRYHLFVEIGYDVPGRTGRSHAHYGIPFGRAPLWGTGTVCAANGVTYEYALSGSATRSGDRLDLHVGTPSGVARVPSFDLHGSWHGETLAVTPTHNPFDSDGIYRPERPKSSDDPADPLGATELRKGSVADFEATCRTLARGL